jgi:hypothetical protein
MIKKVKCFGIIIGLALAALTPADDYAWTKTETVSADVTVYGDQYSVVNISGTGSSIVFDPYYVLYVTAKYDVTGSDATGPGWTTPFATKSTSSSSLPKNLYSFYVGAHKAVSNKVYYIADQGHETWTGTMTSGGTTITTTATRNRDYFKSGPEIETIVSDAPGGGQ